MALLAFTSDAQAQFGGYHRRGTAPQAAVTWLPFLKDKTILTEQMQMVLLPPQSWSRGSRLPCWLAQPGRCRCQCQGAERDLAARALLPVHHMLKPLPTMAS